MQRGAEPALYLVDLPVMDMPGRGSSELPADAKEHRSAWTAPSRRRSGATTRRLEFSDLTDAYLGGVAQTLQEPVGVLLLVDARTPGSRAISRPGTWLKSQPCGRAVVGTKVGQITRAERVRHARELESLFDSPRPAGVSADGGRTG